MTARSNVCCKNHPDAHIIEDSRAGDMICSACGLVIGDRCVDVSSEWRTFNDSTTDPSRVGAAENPLLENDLTTHIGRSTSGPDYHNRNSMSRTNRTLQSAYRDINDIADKANLLRIITDEASALFKRVHEQRKLKNKPRLAVCSACIYIACKTNQAARSFKELSGISGVPTKDVAKCYKQIVKVEGNHQENFHNVDPADFVSRFCSKLNLPREVLRVATHIANVTKVNSITDGRSPTSVAAAAIYMSSQVSDTKKHHKEISAVAGVAESTIKQVYRVMLSRAAELIPSDSEFHSRISQLPPN